MSSNIREYTFLLLSVFIVDASVFIILLIQFHMKQFLSMISVCTLIVFLFKMLRPSAFWGDWPSFSKFLGGLLKLVITPIRETISSSYSKVSFKNPVKYIYKVEVLRIPVLDTCFTLN